MYSIIISPSKSSKQTKEKETKVSKAIIMRGGFQPRDEDEEMAEARRRLESVLAGGGAGTGGAGAGRGRGGPGGSVVEQPQGAPPIPANLPAFPSADQQGSPPYNLPFASASAAGMVPPFAQMSQQQRQLAMNLSAASSTSLVAATRAEAALLLQEQQRLAFQRAELEAQLQAQAQIQTEARLASLLQREAQTQDQLRLLRQRQQLDDYLLASSVGAHNENPLSEEARARSSLLNRRSLDSRALSAAAAAVSAPSQGAAGPPFLPHGGASNASARNLLIGELLRNPSSMATNVRPGDSIGAQGSSSLNLANALHQDSLAGKIFRLETAGTTSADRGAERFHGSPSSLIGRSPPFASARAPLTSEGKEESKDEEMSSKPAAVENAEEGGAKSEDDDEGSMSDGEFFRLHPRPPRTEENTGRKPREAFPLKLYRILYEAEQNGHTDIISYFPHGRAFAVHKSKEFIEDIMPKYFGAGRMNTFLKQLNLYNFKRITEGNDKGGYFHPKFMKGKRQNCKNIRRKKTASQLRASTASDATISAAAAAAAASDREAQSPTDFTSPYDHVELSSPESQKVPAASPARTTVGQASPGRGMGSSRRRDPPEESTKKGMGK